MATPVEHLLVMRVGIRATVRRRITDSVSYMITVLCGNNPHDESTTRVTLNNYLKVSPPVNRFEPSFAVNRFEPSFVAILKL